MPTIARLEPGDRPAWEQLFRAYIAFYGRDEAQSMYDRAWTEFQQDRRMHALGAKVDGELVGITHFFIHPSTSSRDVCYLQDLFTAAPSRGHGVGRALISAVADFARAHDCERVYWATRTDNTVARRLYEQVAQNSGFMIYRLPL